MKKAFTSYTFRSIPIDFWRQVKVAAAMKGISIREYVFEALHRALEKEGER